MTTTTTTPIVTIDKSQLKDDLLQAALDAGYTEKEFETFMRREEYRKQYNSKPEVVAKRKQYNKVRNLRFKLIKEALKAVDGKE